jgi:hypothetical protein
MKNKTNAKLTGVPLVLRENERCVCRKGRPEKERTAAVILATGFFEPPKRIVTK